MRLLIVLSLALAALGLADCQQSVSGASPDDMSLGNPHAKVTVIEYASVACPHCAAFNNSVFPAFKAKYIDTGKVFYIAREALTADPAIAAAGFLTARCAGKDKYFQVVDAIYHDQTPLETGDDPHAVLLQIARSAGLTDAQFEACIRDPKAIAALNARWKRYIDEDKINATPTFVINGERVEGDASLATLDSAIAKAQAGGGSPA